MSFINILYIVIQCRRARAMHSLKELHEQPLNEGVAADLFDLYACVPTCKTARDIFVSVVP